MSDASTAATSSSSVTPAPSSSSSPAIEDRLKTWSCPKCTVSNHNLTTECSACHHRIDRGLTAVFPANVSSLPTNIKNLFDSLITSLPSMDKRSMSGRCHPETCRMEEFLLQNFGFANVRGEYFVQGVKKFLLKHSPEGRNDEEKIMMKHKWEDDDLKAGEENAIWEATIGEVKQWQKSYKVYVPSDIYSNNSSGLELIKKSCEGKSKSGEEAFKMKFAVRMSINPIVSSFDGRVHPRNANREWDKNIYLQSVSGIDFAGRIHDVMDLEVYMKNYRSVYEFNMLRQPLVVGERDLVPTGKPVQLDEDRLLKDLKKMFRIRLYAADMEKIDIVIETGIGLGVFSGDYIGIGETVRQLTARSIREVLEEDEKKLAHVKAIIFALPMFKPNDNLVYYYQEFNQSYKGSIPLLLADQDMHALAIAAAKAGFRVSELNPADSHGVFGEYWQNRGPGTEEKLALTTLGLLTQHHVSNPEVLNTNNYIFVDIDKYNAKAINDTSSSSASA